MKIYQKIAALIFISAIIFSACAENKDKKLAEQTVEKFHQLYNEQNYEEIFNTAHEDAKRTKSKEKLGLVLAESFDKYGKYLSSELVYSKITTLNQNEKQVELAYKSKFERGARNETFLVVTDDEKGALYSIGELTDEQLKNLK